MIKNLIFTAISIPVLMFFLLLNVAAMAQSTTAPTDKPNESKKNGTDDSHSQKQSSERETYEKQKVQKLEKDEGRYQQLKKDADPRGRTEENKANFDTDVPRGEGVQYPPAKNPNQPN